MRLRPQYSIADIGTNLAAVLCEYHNKYLLIKYYIINKILYDVALIATCGGYEGQRISHTYIIDKKQVEKNN